MKNVILIIVLFSSFAAFSQIPSQSRRDSGDVDDYPVVVMEDDGYNSKGRIQVFSEGTKYGLKRNDSILLKPAFERIDFSDGGFVLRNAALLGFADKNDKIVLGVEFDSIGIGTKSFIVKKAGKYGVFSQNGIPFVPIKQAKILYANALTKIALIRDKDNQLQLFLGNKIADIAFENIMLYENMAIVNNGKKQGLIYDGRLAGSIEYDKISAEGKSLPKGHYSQKMLEIKKYFDFRSSLTAVILEKDNKFGLFAKGKMIYPVEYDKITNEPFRGIAVVEKNKLKGAYLIGTNQKLDVVYDDIYLDGAQFIEVKKNNLSGMLDYKLNVILPLEYDDIQVAGMNQSFRIIKNKKNGWIDQKAGISIPAMYDRIEHFTDIRNTPTPLFIVQNNELSGVIDGNNKTILPLEFEFVFERNNFICGKTKEGKFGLYRSDGTVMVKPEYNFIFESVAEGSQVLFAQKDALYTILGKKGNIIYNNSIKKYGYIHDEENLLSPESTSGRNYLMVQDDKNKFGVFDEINERQCLPFIYDEIRQKILIDRKEYFIVSKGDKFGVVDDQNTIAIPFAYESLSFDLLNSFLQPLLIPAKKNNKYGLISLTGKEVVPFIYQDIQRISASENLFKAKSNNKYTLINGSGKSIISNTFDDIANFEGSKTLTFNNKTMKQVNSDGQFTGVGEEMTMHNGYKSFEDLKQALIAALNSPTNDLLLEFSTKIAPSRHILFYMKTNIFDQKPLADVPSQTAIAQQYYKELERFKNTKWKDEKFFNKAALTFVDDYTRYDNRGLVTNERIREHAFGDQRFLEKLLRNSVKVNGYWISSYFMKRNFSISDY